MELTSHVGGRYLPRVVDAEVAAGLRAMPAVVLEGPRACGKTSTGLVVLTATGYGYRRDDGVLVVPLTALGP